VGTAALGNPEECEKCFMTPPPTIFIVAALIATQCFLFKVRKGWGVGKVDFSLFHADLNIAEITTTKGASLVQEAIAEISNQNLKKIHHESLKFVKESI
jgi:hypothetical protein